jgi:vacuolar-type H+-ATPase subunit E/Vma4
VESAAWSAAESVESAAWSAARSAAWSAARSAARSAESAESAAYLQMADKLIELIEAAA